MRKLAIVLLLGATVLGCSHQEFNRPISSWVTDRFDQGEPYLDPDKSPEEIQRERLSEVLAAWQSLPRHAEKYTLGPGDMLEVGIFALESPDKTTTLKCSVSREGSIILPWVGRITAGGLSVRQLVETVKAAYAGKYIKNPQVTVRVTEFRSSAVMVTGAVAAPGVYYLSENTTTLLALLGKAGGLTKDAGNELLLVRTKNPTGQTSQYESNPSAAPTQGEKTANDTAEGAPDSEQAILGRGHQQIIRIHLKQLVEEGNLLFNIELVNGDVVTVPSIAEQRVYVLGYVSSAGAIPVEHGHVEALRAVAMAGGLNVLARAENSYVVRDTGNGERPKVVRVDLTKIARGVRPPLYLQPGDTLVVGSSIIARLSEFIRPSAGASASYSVAAP